MVVMIIILAGRRGCKRPAARELLEFRLQAAARGKTPRIDRLKPRVQTGSTG
jgi:hypothetical protein